MRIKRFFRYFDLDDAILAKFICNLFGFSCGHWYLTLGRTNWEFGCFKINFLVLAVVYKGVAIPHLRTLLNKKGNSSCYERQALLSRFISCFGRDVIAGILADREFVGKL